MNHNKYNYIYNINEINKLIYKVLGPVYDSLTTHIATHIYKYDDYITLKNFAKQIIQLVDMPNIESFIKIIDEGYMGIKFTETNITLRKIINILNKEHISADDIWYLNTKLTPTTIEDSNYDREINNK
jgi:hypothetical protein